MILAMLRLCLQSLGIRLDFGLGLVFGGLVLLVDLLGVPDGWVSVDSLLRKRPYLEGFNVITNPVPRINTNKIRIYIRSSLLKRSITK